MTARASLLGLIVLLATTIVVIEVIRWRRGRPFDVLLLVSGIYFLAYVIAPLQYILADLRAFRPTSWNWLLQFDPRAEQFVYGEALGLLSYLTIVISYLAVVRAARRRGTAESRRPGPSSRLLLSRTLWLGLAGAGALLGYTISIGGLGPLLFQAAAFRTNPPVVTPWAFLKNLAPLVVAAAYVAAGLAATEARPRWLKPLAAVLWLLALLTMFHRAARLPLLLFLVTVPIAGALRRRRVPVRLVVAGSLLFLVVVLFGKQVFAGGRSAEAALSHWDVLKENATFGLQSVVIEFSFPFVAAGNAVINVPRLTPFRYFADFGIAPLYLVPQRLTGLTPPPTVSAVNSGLLHSDGTIPTDIVTLGWFSLGLPGVVLVALAYGTLAGLVDTFVRRRLGPEGPLGALGVAWMFFAATAALYADPQMVLEGGFYLYVATAVLLFRLRPGTVRSAPGMPAGPALGLDRDAAR